MGSFGCWYIGTKLCFPHPPNFETPARHAWHIETCHHPDLTCKSSPYCWHGSFLTDTHPQETHLIKTTSRPVVTSMLTQTQNRWTILIQTSCSRLHSPVLCTCLPLVVQVVLLSCALLLVFNTSNTTQNPPLLLLHWLHRWFPPSLSGCSQSHGKEYNRQLMKTLQTWTSIRTFRQTIFFSSYMHTSWSRVFCFASFPPPPPFLPILFLQHASLFSFSIFFWMQLSCGNLTFLVPV